MLVEVIWVSGCRVQLRIWGLRVLGLGTIGFRVADVTPFPPRIQLSLTATSTGSYSEYQNERYRAHIHQGLEQGGMLQKA